MIQLVGGGQDTRADWPDFRSLSTLPPCSGEGRQQELWGSVSIVTLSVTQVSEQGDLVPGGLLNFSISVTPQFPVKGT